MSDLYLFIFMNIMFFLIGFPFSKLLPSNIFKMRLLIAPTLGYGISAVIITVLYKWGISTSLSFRTTCRLINSGTSKASHMA